LISVGKIVLKGARKRKTYLRRQYIIAREARAAVAEW
jgi:hypothetical protein